MKILTTLVALTIIVATGSMSISYAAAAPMAKTARQCIGVNGLAGKKSGIYCKQCYGIAGLPGGPTGIVCKYVPIAD